MPGGVNRQGAWLWYIPVYKSIRLGLSTESADFHDTAQVINKEIAFLWVIAYLSPHFEDTAQRVETVGVSFAA